MSRTKAMLSVRDLVYQPVYTKAPVIQGLSYEFKPGNLYTLRGANGSGKTTLLKLLSGIYAPDSGEVLWQNESISLDLPSFQSQALWMGHELGLSQVLTVQETLAWTLSFFPPLQSLSLKRVIEQLDLGLILNQLVGECSAGQKRRLSLARLWLCKRSLWLLDEPCMNLDSEISALVEEQIQNVMDEGAIVVMSTHQSCGIDATIILTSQEWEKSS